MFNKHGVIEDKSILENMVKQNVKHFRFHQAMHDSVTVHFQVFNITASAITWTFIVSHVIRSKFILTLNERRSIGVKMKACCDDLVTCLYCLGKGFKSTKHCIGLFFYKNILLVLTM